MDIYEQQLISAGYEAVIEGELYEDERVQWRGKPRAGRMIWRTLPIVLFGIPWTAFAVFWTWGASGGMSSEGYEEGFSWFGLFGVPFILIGLGMLSSPIWVYLAAKRTVYVVTDRRALIFEKGFSIQVRSFEGEKLRETIKRIRSDGSGDIIFERGYKWNSGDDNTRMKEFGFFGIERVNEVEEMLRDIAAQSNRKTGAER